MLQSLEFQEQIIESSRPHEMPEKCNLDEPTRMAYYLFNCSTKFLSSEPTQVLPAMKCLYMALSMVLAPQIEVELRLALGNILLDYTKNYDEALEQIQKAHQLAESVSNSNIFVLKCSFCSPLALLNLMKSAELQDR